MYMKNENTLFQRKMANARANDLLVHHRKRAKLRNINRNIVYSFVETDNLSDSNDENTDPDQNKQKPNELPKVILPLSFALFFFNVFFCFCRLGWSQR